MTAQMARVVLRGVLLKEWNLVFAPLVRRTKKIKKSVIPRIGIGYEMLHVPERNPWPYTLATKCIS
jgi:hypothetical protein